MKSNMTLIYLLIGIALLTYVGMPLLIKNTLRIRARPAMSPATPTHFDESVQQFFAASAAKLATLRFEQAAVFTIEQATPGVTSHVALWLNRGAGQAAAVNVMISRGGDKPNRVKRYVEFLTRVQEGVSVTTNNSSNLGAFKKTRGCDSLSAQHLHDLTHLYRLHLWREEKFAGKSAPRCLPAPGSEVSWFADLFEESIKRQLDTGYLQYTGGDVYVPTLPGAYFMTWAELPPMKPLRRSAEDRRAEAQVCQAADIPFAPPANVPVITETPPGGGHNTPPMRKVA
ncbi:MAG: hypothetical protein QOE14_1067 [Humisphaera sp.]|nr:hypothetical protein [Humisphaera sp.]